jgi:hypothetical protein
MAKQWRVRKECEDISEVVEFVLRENPEDNGVELIAFKNGEESAYILQITSDGTIDLYSELDDYDLGLNTDKNGRVIVTKTL